MQLPADAGGDSIVTPIVISKDNVTIRGYGQSYGDFSGATTLMWAGGDSVAITIKAHSVTLEKFVLGNAVDSGRVGIRVANGVDFTTLQDINIVSVKHFSVAAFQVQSDAKIATWVTLRHCWIGASAPIGADIDYSNLVVIQNSTFVNNATNVRVGQTGIVTSFYFIAGSNAQAGNASGSGAIDIDLVNVESATIQDSYFETANDDSVGVEDQLAVRVGSAANNVLIAGNYMNGTKHTNYAMYVNSSAAVTVLNNTFRGYLLGALHHPYVNVPSYNNRAIDSTPATTSFLVPETDQSTFGSSAQRWTANLYSAGYYRSEGNPDYPDIYGNGVDSAVVIGGTVSGAGQVRLGTATTLSAKADIVASHIRLSNATALGSGAFAKSAGWGTGSSFGYITGSDAAFQVVVNSGTGTSANPTVTVTFGVSWVALPIYVCSMSGGGSGPAAVLLANASTSLIVITYSGTPTATKSYILACLGVGS